MTYLYDGRRLVGIECRTWDNEEHAYRWPSAEEGGLLHPENEWTTETAMHNDGLGKMAVRWGEAYIVGDVQWYINEAQHWARYEWGDNNDDYTEQEEGESARYERSAEICEMDVEEMEREYDPWPEEITLDAIKARCKRLRGE